MHRHSILSVLAILFFLQVGCAGTGPPQVVPHTAGPPYAVRWVVDSAEYRALLIQTYRNAGERLVELARGREPGSWAVAVDADETLIGNSGYSVMLHETGSVYSDESWREWVLRMEAPALPGAREFLLRVHELGGRIAVVTNRPERDCPETRENLRREDLPFDFVLCRSGESREKEGRWEAIRRGEADPEYGPLEILMWVGDNIGDFPGLDQTFRHADEEAFADFGGRFVVLPNPMYGSWE